MSELTDALYELRDVGVRRLPEAGDAGDRRLRAALESEMAGHRGHRLMWIRRKIAIGGLGVPPLVLGVVATAAAATGALMAANATTIFQRNPEAPGNVLRQTVIPSSVRELVSATVPAYGEVQFWGATTTQRGFCFAIKLPDGSWGGYPNPADSRHDGWYGGTIPGCMPTLQQQEIGARSGRSRQIPEPLEWRYSWVKTGSGQLWQLDFGFVTAQDHAAKVQDTTSGITAPVTPEGYFLLAQPGRPANGVSSSGETQLRVLNAAGRALHPDYRNGKLLPGYTVGPSSG